MRSILQDLLIELRKANHVYSSAKRIAKDKSSDPQGVLHGRISRTVIIVAVSVVLGRKTCLAVKLGHILYSNPINLQPRKACHFAFNWFVILAQRGKSEQRSCELVAFATVKRSKKSTLNVDYKKLFSIR